MEKTPEKETRDFMNVESFSQLPFIRPPPHAPSVKEKGIRLFGIEFGSGSTATTTTTDEDSADYYSSTEETIIGTKQNNDDSTTTNVDNHNRRFECHYCCRNFPTSQALGGHQNAHKRERQHAKRAHLHSAMVRTSFADVYGLMNYTKLTAAAAAPINNTYPSWTSSSSTHSRFYGNNHSSSSSYSHHQPPPPPINGSPLGLWRIPGGGATSAVQTHQASFNRDHSMLQHPLPLFASDQESKPSHHLQVGSSSQSRFIFESKPSSQQDHVSLDLHL